jgi:hypothetical protein
MVYLALVIGNVAECDARHRIEQQISGQSKKVRGKQKVGCFGVRISESGVKKAGSIESETPIARSRKPPEDFLARSMVRMRGSRVQRRTTKLIGHRFAGPIPTHLQIERDIDLSAGLVVLIIL